MDVRAEEQRYLAAQSLKNDVASEQIYQALEQLEEHNDLLRTTLDNSGLLAELENKLRGRIIIHKGSGEVVSKKVTEPVMNDEGINAALSIIMAFADRGQILANISEYEKRVRMEYIVEVFITEMMAQSNTYSLNPLQRSRVNAIVFSTIDNFMSRAIGRQEGKDVYGRTKAIEHLQRTASDNRGRGFSFFGFGGNKE